MSYEEQDVIWRVALASYDPREMRVWTRYLEERNPAIRCTGYRSSRTLLERLEQGDVDVLVLGGRLEDMDSIQFLPKIRGLARKPLVLLRDDGRNEKSAVESLSQEDACYLIRQATLEDMLQELRARHIKVPEQVKLASFYDSELLTSSTPQISAAQFDGERLGATACRMLLDILAGKQIALRQMQGYQVILRESTK